MTACTISDTGRKQKSVYVGLSVRNEERPTPSALEIDIAALSGIPAYFRCWKITDLEHARLRWTVRLL
jgi:hypothetical protein